MIPLATTTITVVRLVAPTPEVSPADSYDTATYDSAAYDATATVPAGRYVDGYEAAPTETTIASGVRAHLSAPSGTEQQQTGSAETVTWRLLCDPTDLHHADLIIDEPTGQRFDVEWTRAKPGLGLDHTVAGVRQLSGVV